MDGPTPEEMAEIYNQVRIEADEDGLDYVPISDLQERTAKAQLAFTFKRFKDALDQSRKDEPLDLSNEEYELFESIGNEAVAKAHRLSQKDRPETDTLRKPLPLNDVPTIATGGTSLGEAKDSSSRKGDRPDREKTLREILKPHLEMPYDPMYEKSPLDNIIAQISALFPDEEGMDCDTCADGFISTHEKATAYLQGEITKLNKKLDDREADLIEAKIEHDHEMLAEKGDFIIRRAVVRQALKEGQ